MIKTSHRLPIHIKPLHYKIILKPNLESFIFSGEETIELSIDKPIKSITLHAAELKIQTAKFANIKGKVSYNKKNETATINFPKIIKKGKGLLEINFSGILNDKMRGFYKSSYVYNGEQKFLATTQFESTDARRAFPCFDEPAQKAIFDVTLIVKKDQTVISNTIESSILEHDSNYKIVKFAPTPKMSTYLLAFLVGDFEHIEKKTKNNITVRVFTTPGKKNQAKFALDVAVKCMEFYNNYFGIEYPLSVLDMIAIPDFAAGAMENWGAVTYRESTLLVEEQNSSAGNKQWVALVIAHELAHQWFGNLVTMEWWTHLWLNEGFASFIEYLAIDSIFPDWDIWTQFVSTEMADAFSLDALENTHPIEVEVKDVSEISEIFDRVSYSKGASVIRMLWQYLGEENFQKGLQHYLKVHAYGNTKTEDLWRALEEVSKKPVLEVMKNWTGKAGHPIINVKIKNKNEELELTQSRFFSSPISKKASKDKTVWNIPLQIQNSSIRKAQDKSQSYLINNKSVTIPNNQGKLNVGETSLVRVDYPKEYLKKLEHDVKNKKLQAVDRLGLIRDSFDLAQSGNSPTTLALELAKSYKDEDNYTVWASLTGHISQVDSLLALEPFYQDFRVYGRELYFSIAHKMGWKKRSGEKHTDSLLRGIALSMLGGFGDKETIKKAQEMFSSKEKIDPDLKGIVYNLVSENGGELEFNTLLKMYKAEDNQQEKDRIGRALGKFKSKEILLKTLNFSISKDVRYQNSLQIIASAWHNPNGRYLAWDFVKKNWELLKKRYAGGHYFTRVFGPAGEFSKVSDAKAIEDFVEKNPVPEAKRTIAQALEQIYSNAAWLSRDRKQIQNFLSQKS